jgi:hypothetical protein
MMVLACGHVFCKVKRISVTVLGMPITNTLKSHERVTPQFVLSLGWVQAPFDGIGNSGYFGRKP